MGIVIPEDDRHQALRIKRFLMAFGTYLVWMLIAVYCDYTGMFVRYLLPVDVTFVAILITNAIMYAVLRSGLNKRFKDPSLTMAQMALATLWTMLMAYSLDTGRQIMLMLYMVVFIFGTFRLNLRQFWCLTAFALAGYAWVVELLFLNDPLSVNLKLEFFSLITLFTVLAWFSFMGSYINNMRKRLSKANSELNNFNCALAEANDLIRQQAIHDDLTGVYNRGHLFTILTREKGLADRGETMFCVCIFDLDDFKKVNDSFGHQAGDEVLKTLCARIGENIRKEDYLARYGGEEFVLVLAYPDLIEGRVCAERVRAMVQGITLPGLPGDYHVTISMGLTRYQPAEDIDTLMKRVDEALYRAKNSGKNALVCTPPPALMTATG
jgi:diguanylate cyclase